MEMLGKFAFIKHLKFLMVKSVINRVKRQTAKKHLQHVKRS